MRYPLFTVFALFLMLSAAHAQSVSDNIPPFNEESEPEDAPIAPATPSVTVPVAPATDPFTVMDVKSDITADTAANARDKALAQAERDAYGQVCGRLGAPNNASKLDDDAIAGLVQSFEVQSEHVSAVRYIGVFTIRFKALSVQKRIGKSLASPAETASGALLASGEAPKPSFAGPVAHLAIGVQTASLAEWTSIRKRLNAVPQVAQVQTIDLTRGLSHIDLSYGGSLPDLQNILTNQGLILRQNALGGWELFDGSMVTR